ncbi:hypothetical protein [Actinokineospora cianjurensis]|uniref:Secreted protein n=1 Tax=Actinokineospora cianjurensis TaxID=585224 RepID=A0A421B2T3_9PSEU|nr:hypothetical protein [Actinokineospora cianjurensis]RLK58568.1 hypothetical protein CLV68_3036 [Actinokineospora cianjurensis]
MSFRAQPLRALTATTALCLLGLLTPTPAQATPALVACVGDVEVNFTPGLTYTTQTVAVSGSENATTCTSLTHPNLRSFSAPFSGSTERSCLALLAEGTGDETLLWDNSTTSHWEWTSHPTQTGSALVVATTGLITSGTLAGATVTQELVVTANTLDACTQPGGLTQLDGASTWQFTRL